MYPQNDINSVNEKISKLIDLQSDQISNDWFKALKQKWKKKADQKINFIVKEKGDKEDLLSLLLEVLPPKTKIKDQHLNPIFRKVRTETYSIFDFFLEVTCLEDSVKGVLMCSNEINEADLLEGLNVIRKRLYSIFGIILKDTSEIYEHVAESGVRAFCHLDTEGKIIYDNREMKRLVGLKSVEGKRLDSFFDGEERIFVKRILDPNFKEHQGMRQLNLKNSVGRLIPVGLDIASIFIDGMNRGGYVSLVDLSHRIKTDMAIFDKSPLGIVRTNHLEQFTYANPKALDICGIDTWENKNIKDIFPDEKNYSKIKSHLDQRKMGLSDEYEVEITRLDDKKWIPVKISATPEFDLKGKFVGSMAIVQDMLRDKKIEAIHDHVATIREGKKILEKVSKEIEEVIPFDRFSVIVLNDSMTHLRQLFSYYPTGQMEYKIRWWEIPDYLVDWLTQKRCTTFDNINALVEEFEWKDLIERPGVKEFLEEGFNSFIRCPIFKGDRIVASVSLYSKKEKAFDNTHKELLEALPIHKAVLMALYYEEIKDLNFRLNLMKDISSSARDIDEVAEDIVNRIVENYEWQDVALFKVDEERQVFRLLSQKAKSGNFRLPDDYQQSLDEGILGYVYKNNESVNVGNVKTDPKFKNIFKDTLKGTKSELCIPIKASEVFWFLNIEDSNQNSFSIEEEEALTSVLNELREFLDRLYLYNFLNASLKYSSDGVIVTDSNGKIKKANPAIVDLLGCFPGEMIDDNLASYLKDNDNNELLKYLLKNDEISSAEVTLYRKNNDEVDVLLSKSQLKKDFSDKVFFITDLSMQKRLLELEYLEGIYYEIATQTKTPLSLVFSWLRRLKKEFEEESNTNIDRLDEIIRQLRKVELSYDRLALYDKAKGLDSNNMVLLDFNRLLDNVLDDFPKSERDAIKNVSKKQKFIIDGDIFQLSFCIKTILSYLLRFIPENEHITINMSQILNKFRIEIKGSLPEYVDDNGDDIDLQSQISRAKSEIALGKEVIESFLINHAGSYSSELKGNKAQFFIELPIKKDNDHEH